MSAYSYDRKTMLHLQQILVTLQALSCSASNYWRYGAPLRRHQLGQMQQLFIFLARPFRLLNTRIQPLVPARFALFGRFSMQQRGNTTPLIFAIFHYGRLENLILKANAWLQYVCYD